MNVYWLEQTEGDVPADSAWLSAEETAFLSGLRFPKRRADWRLGRWTAKCAVTAYLKIPAFAEIEIRPAASGAPEVFVEHAPAPVVISLSHRAGRAVCAVAPVGIALGCDLELIEPRSDAFVADYFAAEEQTLIARTSAAERCRLVALLWSAKESALKALHEGLRRDTRSVIVSLEADEPGGGWNPLQVRCSEGAVFNGWWLEKPDLLRTLVAAPPPARPVPC